METRKAKLVYGIIKFMAKVNAEIIYLWCRHQNNHSSQQNPKHQYNQTLEQK